MKLLVEYVDFHSDNHQGGSGTSFEFQTAIEITMPCDDVWEAIHKKMSEIVLKQRPFFVASDSKYPSIKRVTLL